MSSLCVNETVSFSTCNKYIHALYFDDLGIMGHFISITGLDFGKCRITQLVELGAQ